MESSVLLGRVYVLRIKSCNIKKNIWRKVLKKILILLIFILFFGISVFSQNIDGQIYQITQFEELLRGAVPGNDIFGLFIENFAEGSAAFLTFSSPERAARDPFNNYSRSMIFEYYDPDDNRYNRFILNGNIMEHCTAIITAEGNYLSIQVFLLSIPMLLLEAIIAD